MHTYARLVRATIVGTMLVASLLTRLVGESETDAPAKTLVIGNASEVSDQIVLSGIIFMGGKPLASLHVKGARGSEWRGVNDLISGYLVKEITQNNVVLVHRDGGKELTVFLAGATIKDDGSEGGAKMYSKAWINSHANPMLRRMQPLPPEVVEKWESLSVAEKERIVEFYKNHGWQILSIQSIGGLMDLSWKNMYGEERSAVVRANLNTFTKSLSPEQKEIWEKIQTNQPIRGMNGKVSEDQEKEAAERRRVGAQFKNSLSPQQKAAFEGINDFTAAEWK